MVCDFDNALVQRKTVEAGRGNIRTEKRKTFREKKTRLLRTQMKDRMRRRAQKFRSVRQQVWGPRASRHDHCVSIDSMSILQNDAFDALVAFIEIGELCLLAQLDESDQRVEGIV